MVQDSILSWVNIPVFDYRGFLRVDHSTLFMWLIMDEDVLSDHLLNPIGKYQQCHMTRFDPNLSLRTILK